MTVLDVCPVGYAEAARTIGGEVAGTVALACGEVTRRLDACYGMAGSDDVGAEWGAAYDGVAASAIQSTAAVVDAAYTVAALLEQTGINYAGAEAASVPGETAEQSQARWASSSAPSVRDLASAVGGGVPEPAGWSILRHAIGRLWPNGHQDLLHGAADTWRAIGSWFRSITVDVDRAVVEVMLQRAPEVSDAAAVIDGLRGQLTELAGVYDDLADACSDYAHHLDAAHHRILEEIHSFIEWTLAIEAAGGLLAVVTLGASEVVAQGAELERAKVTGAAIAAVIDGLRAAVAALGVTLRGAEARVAVVAEQARVVVIRRVEAAGVVRPGVAGVEAARTVGPADTALVRLEESAATEKDARPGNVALGHSGIHQYPGIAAHKSQFFDRVDVYRLSDTRSVRGVAQPNGRSKYVMHARDDVGTDRSTGMSTNIYTIIKDENGEVVTMYPGTSPKS